MTSPKLLTFFVLSALTLLLFFAPSDANALSSPSFLRHANHVRLAEKRQIGKRDSKKCRQRFSPAPAPSPSQHDAPKPTNDAPKPTQSHSSGSNSGGSNIISDANSVGLGFFSQKSKLGLAWPDGNAGYLNNLAGVKYMYTWGASCPSNAVNLGMTCLPQLWGWKNLNDFQQVSKTVKPPLWLTFNEPQEPGQANMDVGSGVALWRQAIKPLTDKGHKVCSPATSSNPNGLEWVKNFQKQCPDCKWDVTCIHWYDTTFDKFKTYVELWHNTFGKPVMVTEFGVQNFNGGSQPTSGEVFSFMDQAVPWMNSQPYILAFFPFGFMAPPTGINKNMNLLNGDGSVTSLGWVVLNKSGAK